MINKKEDLNLRCVSGRNTEVVTALISKSKELGLTVNPHLTAYVRECIGVKVNESRRGSYEVDFSTDAHYRNEMKMTELSLSDFDDIEPRVKIDYVKVHCMEAIKAVMEGSKDYWLESGECYVHLNMESSLEEFCRASKQVRVPIEWWEDAKACHDSFKTGFGSQYFHRNEDNDTITIAGEYTRDQLCDLARELLEFND